MKNYIFAWLFIYSCHQPTLAQTQNLTVTGDTIANGNLINKANVSPVEEVKTGFRPSRYIIPATLMTAGLLTQGQFSRHVRAQVIRRYPDFRTSVDDYLQITPSIAVLALGASGLKGRHTFGDQVILTVLSNAVSQGITQTIKYTVAYPRPDGNGQDAFPSGHTAAAFTGATVLAHEYGQRSSWYAVAGYATATTVAGYRVLQNRHWLADVLFGAGVGIGATELVYQVYPWLKHLAIHRKQTVLMPTYSGSSAGLYLTSVF